MRISDWSSDVCSSDLNAAASAKGVRMSESASTITSQVVADHGLNEEEYARILKALGREPNLTELGIFSVMWSEHCSYKSSRRSEEHTSELQSLMRISYAVFCLTKKIKKTRQRERP